MSEKRNELRNEMRRTGVPVQRVAEIKERISELSKELKSLRQDVTLCEAIVVRSLEIAERNVQLKQLKEKDAEKQREQTHEKTRAR